MKIISLISAKCIRMQYFPAYYFCYYGHIYCFIDYTKHFKVNWVEQWKRNKNNNDNIKNKIIN